MTSFVSGGTLKLAFHDADADTDFLVRILAMMSARKLGSISRHRHPDHSQCREMWPDFLANISARILARKSASRNASLNLNSVDQSCSDAFAADTEFRCKTGG